MPGIEIASGATSAGTYSSVVASTRLVNHLPKSIAQTSFSGTVCTGGSVFAFDFRVHVRDHVSASQAQISVL